MSGATSLVQLILKKWGDDIAGAAKELEEKVGFPESVANRIATGELAMDEASIAKRIKEQGYSDVLYRGHHRDYPPQSNQDMWMTDSEDVAETYADSRTMPFITPLRTNANYHGPGNLAYVRGDGKMHDKVTTNSIKNPGIEQGIIRGTDNIAEVVKESGQYQGTHFRNIKDEAQTTSSTEPSDVYNILGSRPDVKIRHPDAAFDPEYTGKNIMGNATVPMMSLLATGSAGAGILLNSLFAEAERAKK